MRSETISLISCGTSEKDFRFEISSTRLQATPTWVPESEVLPLSPNEAIRIGTPYACEQRPRFDSCVCIRIAIMSVTHCLTPTDHWFYHLEFAPVMDERTYASDTIPVVLLLDGTVVEPRVTNAEPHSGSLMSNNADVKTILILLANPVSTSRLQLDEEVRKIHEAFQHSRKRQQFNLVSRWAVRSQDFFQAILDHQPQIVHFSGHGAGKDGILLEDNVGQPALVKTDALIEAFSTNGVECVVLNACSSQVQAEAISQHINYVISINREIGDRTAIDFAGAFYQSLASGKDVESAFKLARSRLINVQEHLTPVLKKRMLQ